MNIAIDIGHAHRTGANGLYEGAEIGEHDLCTIIAPWLKTHLQEAGHRADIIDFATATNAADLQKTIAAVNAGPRCGASYDVVLSLHCDWSASPAAHGAHVCYVSPRGRKLADCIAHYLCNLMPGRAETVSERHDLAILNRTRPVTVLIECGFITNKANQAMLVNCPVHIARAIAKGVMDYCRLAF